MLLEDREHPILVERDTVRTSINRGAKKQRKRIDVGRLFGIINKKILQKGGKKQLFRIFAY